MKQYVAFLRGINSGRNPTTKMDVLRKTFEDLGFTHVKTVIASGNVLFETQEIDTKKLEEKIEQNLPKTIGFQSVTIVCTVDQLKKLVNSQPFKNVKLTSDLRPYVTFVKDSKTAMKFPFVGKGYTIVGITNGVVCSVVDHTSSKTPDLMKVLDREWGGNTTRGWKTIERIISTSI